MSLSYLLMRPKTQVSVTASISAAYSYCTYDVKVTSITNQAGANVNQNAIWAWTDHTDVKDGDSISFGVESITYDPSMVDDYTVSLRFDWSTAETLTV